MDGDLFDCTVHRMRLTPPSCARFWLKARDLPPKSWDTAAKCKGCAIGAANAGQKPETSVAPDPLDSRCCRCGRPALKFLYDRLCVSCYNRHTEVMRGRNARGNVPVAPSMRPFSAAVLLTGKDHPSIKTIDAVTSGAEALAALARRQSTENLLGWDGSNQVME